MPELPEVETTCRALKTHMLGQVIQNIDIKTPKLRWPINTKISQCLIKKKITAIERRAKYILIYTTGGLLVVHLGMSGHMKVLPLYRPLIKHDHFIINFKDFSVRLNDARRFGAVLFSSDSQMPKQFEHLGVEPLEDSFTAQYLWQKAQKRSIPVKAFVMDQKVVVGVGNIYATESLYLAHIHPMRPCHQVSIQEYTTLIKHIQRVLQKAIASGGTTLKDFQKPEGKPGYFAQKLKIYGKTEAPCPSCKTLIQQVIIQGRSSAFCPSCQV